MRALFALIALAATPLAARTVTVPLPTVAAMVAGAEACATKSLSDAQMAERLKGLGWEAKAAKDPAKGMRIVLYARENVELTYFTSKPMKQCVVTGRTAAGFDKQALLDALTIALKKEPKADIPEKRYLYFLPRLDILTAQFKTDDKGSFVELSVVQ